MNIITLQEYKTFKGLGSDPKNDDKLNFLISSVSNLIKTYLRINYTAGVTLTETIPVDYETDTIFLTQYPIANIISITESGRYTYDATVHVPLTGAIDYVADLNIGSILRTAAPGGFSKWPVHGTVTVEYTKGPSTWMNGIEYPFDLKLAALNLVDYYKDEEYKQSKSIQGTSVVNTLAQGEDFPQHIQVILDRYSERHVHV